MGHTPDDDGREVFGAVLTEPLDGGDFVMRRAREDDLPTIMGLVDDVMRTRLMLPDPDLELTRLMVLHAGALVIADAETDAPLGGIRMFLHGDAVEFGYWLGADARGRGLATRALALVSARSSRGFSPRGSSCARRSVTSRASASLNARATRGSAGAADRVSRRPDRRDDALVRSLPRFLAGTVVVDDAAFHPTGPAPALVGRYRNRPVGAKP